MTLVSVRLNNELEAFLLEVGAVAGVSGAEDYVLPSPLNPHLFTVLFQMLEFKEVEIFVLILERLALSLGLDLCRFGMPLPKLRHRLHRNVRVLRFQLGLDDLAEAPFVRIVLVLVD